MEFTIHANETETVLGALESYRELLTLQIGAVKNSKDNYRSDEIIALLEKRKETLNRLIDRIKEL